MKTKFEQNYRPDEARLILSGDYIDALGRTRHVELWTCYGAVNMEIDGNPGGVAYETFTEAFGCLCKLMTDRTYCEQIRNGN